jgi:DNA-binding MarR family transcriptional regulator
MWLIFVIFIALLSAQVTAERTMPLRLQVYQFLIYIYRHLTDQNNVEGMYKRSQEIESRLGEILELIKRGDYCTATLATELQISQPTVSRCLTALRERGYVIRSVRESNGWAYRLLGESEYPKRGTA